MHRKKPKLAVTKRSSPGAPPGTLIPDPNAFSTKISAIAYGREGIDDIGDCKPADIAGLRGRKEVLWIDVTGLADIEAIEAVGEAFDLHRLALEDVINLHQRPKAEHYEDHLFVVFRMLTSTTGANGEQVSMFVGDDFVLTFQERPGDCFDPVRDRLRRQKGMIRRLGADYLAYTLIDAAIDGYFPVLERIGDEIERLEDEIISNPQSGVVDRLHHFKRDLLILRRAIWPTREMLNALMRDDFEQIREQTLPYFRDCHDHAFQLLDIIETYREIIAGLLDVYLSSMSARMNEVMKLLTIIATIFIPLSFIASLYGMNFDRSSPFNMPELGWRFGYPAALLVMILIGGGLLWLFRVRGWLGSPDATNTNSTGRPMKEEVKRRD
jgi:magnesium transporter